MGDLMILGTILLLPLIKRDRWVDKYRVTTIRYNAPVVAIYGKTVIAYNSFYWLLKLKDFDVVFWL
jgi:energy-converting hydrogenase Eha subunit A